MNGKKTASGPFRERWDSEDARKNGKGWRTECRLYCQVRDRAAEALHRVSRRATVRTGVSDEQIRLIQRSRNQDAEGTIQDMILIDAETREPIPNNGQPIETEGWDDIELTVEPEFRYAMRDASHLIS